MASVFFKEVKALPDHCLEVEMETGSSVLLKFGNRIETLRFGKLRDQAVFDSVSTDGTYLIFHDGSYGGVRIGASEFMDLVLIDRTKS